ncbi:glutaredoxin family protein [Weissella viridescens]|uniref:Glutaredoxin family protein n=1 Tax=Weissella viridescens TaxID=1629 RepID=A0A3P2RHN0_WEIVI|nr:glutaredoxin family protein [Weissella viridescens]RRG18250.1 glutaredoxin family protein [Weissella viridescens]
MEVTVYSKNNCGKCSFVKNNLKQFGVDFKEINVDEDDKERAKLNAKGISSMPYVEYEGGSFTGVDIIGLKAIKELANDL